MGSAKAALVKAFSAAYTIVDRRRRLNVVSLHRIGQQQGARLPAQVRHQLTLLKESHRIILPSQLSQFEGYDGPLAMITVDDGHACTYEQLFPICRDLDIPFIAYLPVDYLLHGQWLWFDQLECLYRQTGSMTSEQYHSLQQQLKGLTPDLRAEKLAMLASQWAFDLPAAPVADYAPLGSDDIREMLSSGLFEVGSHAVTHTILTQLDERSMVAELKEAKMILESHFETTVNSFCYPNGLSGDFNQPVIENVRACGYTTAMTSLEGSNIRAQMDPLQLCRIHIGLPDHALLKELSGLGRWQKVFCGDSGSQQVLG